MCVCVVGGVGRVGVGICLCRSGYAFSGDAIKFGKMSPGPEVMQRSICLEISDGYQI